jgi:hypothetical protein
MRSLDVYLAAAETGAMLSEYGTLPHVRDQHVRWRGNWRLGWQGKLQSVSIAVRPGCKSQCAPYNAVTPSSAVAQILSTRYEQPAQP